ncbi:hypothetical protein AB7X03_17325 [Providencia rettgeri]
MKSTDIPKLMPVPFGINGNREELLAKSLTGDNTASYNDGFPPITMTLKSAGGLPPKGQDMNQILYELADAQRWANTGACYQFDEAWVEANGGYPKGAMLSDGDAIWMSTIDDNKTATGGDGWVKVIDPNRDTDFILASDIVQTTGTSTTSVMSQKAVTQELTKYATVENVNKKFNQANNNANSRVPSTRKVNNKALSTDISLNAGDIGAYTKAEVDSKFAAGSGLGYGQTWQNVTASRVIGTNYTNATGKPIFVSVSTNGARDNYIGLDAYVNDVLVARSVGYGGNSKPQATIIVPPGATYKFNYSSGVVGNGISIWSELR